MAGKNVAFGELLEWTIENFSSWNSEIHGLRLQSPKIFVFSSSSGFEVFPRGLSGGEDHMIVRISDVWIKGASGCELSIIGSAGNPLFKKPFFPETFPGNKVLLLPHRNTQIVVPITWSEHAITIRLRLRRHSHAFHRVRTVIDVIDRTFKIPPAVFGKVCTTGKEFVSKSNYTFDGTAQMMIINALVDDATRKVFFELESIPKAKNMIVHSCLHVYDDTNSITKEIKSVFNSRIRFQVLDFPVDAIGNRRFSAIWRIRIVPGSTRDLIDCSHSLGEGVRMTTPTSGRNIELKADNPPNTFRVENAVLDLSKDLQDLFQNQDMPDFTLRCPEASFPAHKSILSARSPVFKAMLNCDMVERLSNSMYMEDMDARSLKAFLLFLYSGSVGDLPWESVLNLYRAGYKYQVSSLQRECATVLKENISIANVCDILSLADQHGDEVLIPAAQDFILENYHEVLRSEEWEDFMRSDPILASQTVTHFGKKNYVGKIKSRDILAN